MEGFGFKENSVDQCIYLKVRGSKFLFLVLYVDDILLASMLHDTKAFLIRNFEMKDMGEPHMSLALRFTKTFPEVSSDYLRRPKSQTKVLQRYGIQHSKPCMAPVQKVYFVSASQCPRSDIEKDQMKGIPYASAVGSVMYAQTCTRPDIAYAVGLLGRYQSNPGMEHWKAAFKVMRYLQGTRD